ncbi:MAG TPA: histidine kinase, partial [Thermoanaerobacter sp.]|nr:histidine kinase [Thermoanaerobacter sp.]
MMTGKNYKNVRVLVVCADGVATSTIALVSL